MDNAPQGTPRGISIRNLARILYFLGSLLKHTGNRFSNAVPPSSDWFEEGVASFLRRRFRSHSAMENAITGRLFWLLGGFMISLADGLMQASQRVLLPSTAGSITMPWHLESVPRAVAIENVASEDAASVVAVSRSETSLSSLGLESDVSATCVQDLDLTPPPPSDIAPGENDITSPLETPTSSPTSSPRARIGTPKSSLDAPLATASPPTIGTGAYISVAPVSDALGYDGDLSGMPPVCYDGDLSGPSPVNVGPSVSPGGPASPPAKAPPDPTFPSLRSRAPANADSPAATETGGYSSVASLSEALGYDGDLSGQSPVRYDGDLSGPSSVNVGPSVSPGQPASPSLTTRAPADAPSGPASPSLSSRASVNGPPGPTSPLSSCGSSSPRHQQAGPQAQAPAAADDPRAFIPPPPPPRPPHVLIPRYTYYPPGWYIDGGGVPYFYQFGFWVVDLVPCFRLG